MISLPISTTLGIILCCYIIYRLVWWLYISFWRPINLQRFHHGTGQQSWALITGATDGIGLAYAHVLAEHGFNIFLVSRNEEKLQKVQQDLLKRRLCKRIKVEYVVSNANDISEANIRRVVEKIGDRPLSILVNNVGVGQGGVKRLCELDPVAIDECIRINCTYPAILTRALIPILLCRPGPKLIINLSSLAALLINPFSSVYSGTKAFNRQFSLALSVEHCQEGLEVLCVDPGFVETPKTMMKPSPVCCTARECAESSLRKIGEMETIPHWKHVWMYLVGIVGTWIPAPWGPLLIFIIVKRLRIMIGRFDTN